jgi:hypothetical protein
MTSILRCARVACVGGYLLLGTLAASAQTAGIEPEWQVQKDLADMSQRFERIQALLDKTTPQDWIRRGAPSAYVEQGKRVRAELGYLSLTTQRLYDHPEKLTLALDTYFRMQSLDALLRSYAAAIRKYQGAALGDSIAAVVDDTAQDRDKLRQYIVDLAADQEREYKMADQEAQRCRALLVRQPKGTPAAPQNTKKEDRR